MAPRRAALFILAAVLPALVVLGDGPSSAVSALRLGQPAPEFTVPDASGHAFRLSDFRGRQHVVLLLCPPGCFEARAETLREASSKLAAFQTTLLVIRPGPASALTGPLVLNDRDGEVARTYLAPSSGSAPVAFFIDKDGILRRVLRVYAPAEDLPTTVAEWLSGQSIFIHSCARCHGEDGMNTDYPFIRTLGGIGNRLNDDEIRTRLRPLVLRPDEIHIRSFIFRPRELDALIHYIAGL